MQLQTCFSGLASLLVGVLSCFSPGARLADFSAALKGPADLVRFQNAILLPCERSLVPIAQYCCKRTGAFGQCPHCNRGVAMRLWYGSKRTGPRPALVQRLPPKEVAHAPQTCLASLNLSVGDL